MTKRTDIFTIIVSAIMMISSSCTREDLVDSSFQGTETHTIFNITISGNTKTKSNNTDDMQISYESEKNRVHMNSKVAFGLVGIDNETADVLVDNQPVYEKNGVRTADLITSSLSSGSMKVSAFYPYTNSVSYHKDGSYAVSFAPNDIEKGPLASNAVDMRCDRDAETVNLNFHHISNSIGFKVCDITTDEQLRGLMYVRKIVVHGMPAEGLFVVDGEESYWVPNAKRPQKVIYEGKDYVEYGEENAIFVANDRLSDDKEDCKRFYVVPEELTNGKHFVEVFFDVAPFDYDGTHYRGVTGMSQIITLSDVIPDNTFELGLQYTFVLGMNLGTVYRPIEFTASVEDWVDRYSGRILDFDNE